MTATDPRRSTREETARDAGSALPHDRDETAAPEADTAHRDANRAVVRQAKDDIDAGRIDTERIGTPNHVPPSKPSR